MNTELMIGIMNGLQIIMRCLFYFGLIELPCQVYKFNYDLEHYIPYGVTGTAIMIITLGVCMYANRKVCKFVEKWEV